MDLSPHFSILPEGHQNSIGSGMEDVLRLLTACDASMVPKRRDDRPAAAASFAVLNGRSWFRQKAQSVFLLPEYRRPPVERQSVEGIRFPNL